MWACVRDWDWAEMRSCGVGLGQFACFKFDERYPPVFSILALAYTKPY